MPWWTPGWRERSDEHPPGRPEGAVPLDQARGRRAIQRVLDNTGFILGEEVKTFEAAFAEYLGASASVGVASGTAALQLALQACGVGRGDEVITTAHTFIATAEPISNLGATPVFVDIDPATFNIDPSCIEDGDHPADEGDRPGPPLRPAGADGRAHADRGAAAGSR